MASGSQVCNPNCADFPITPKNKNKQIKKTSLEGETKLKTEEKSKDPKVFQRRNIAKSKPMSPTLFTNMALIAARFASSLVNQKLINK